MTSLRVSMTIVLIAVGILIGLGYKRRHGEGIGRSVTSKGGRRILYYVDPMHPAYRSTKPGIAPDCGMKLVPVYEGGPSPMPADTIRVSPEKQQLIGVSYGTVEYAGGSYTFRAVGKVAYDETRIWRVHARIDGWIDKVFVDFVGEKIEKGQPLLTIYSPELVASQQEYLLALRGEKLWNADSLGGEKSYSDALVRAARKRLELWELSDEQINHVARTGEPLTYVTLYSPTSGHVMGRNAFPKQRITANTELYTVVDLSKVWIMADVFEYEIPEIRLHQSATVSITYLPGRKFLAHVDYIQPEVDPLSRTLKIRLEADNPGLVLKPDMYVDVQFRVDLPKRLSVPVEAVLDSGVKKTVFVDRGDGYLEPRQVETGEQFGDRIAIIRGLRAGERIVTSANFLIDSESQLKSALADMSGHPHASGDLGAESSTGRTPDPRLSHHEGHGR